MNKNGSTRRWRTLRARVLREDSRCAIRGPGCTGHATTVDHIVPRSKAPQLTYVRSNLRPACQHCNYSRGDGTPRRRERPRPAALSWFDTTPAAGSDEPPATLGG